MTTVADFAANVTEFVLTKLIGRNIELFLDDRKRAARAFVALFQSLEALSNSIVPLEDQLESVASGNAKRLFAVQTEAAVKKIEIETRAFFKSLDKLQAVIKIYDSTLSDTLYGIREGKSRLLGLTELYNDFEIKLCWGNPEYVFSVQVFGLTNDSNVYMQSTYERLPSIGRELLSMMRVFNPDQYNERMRRVRAELGVGDPVKVYDFASNDASSVTRMLDDLREQRKHLIAASAKLGNFIQYHFSIVDLL
jgi:hypothetical protein